MNRAPKSTSKNLVLLFEVLDMLRKFSVRGGSNEGHDWVEKFGHRGIVKFSILQDHGDTELT